MVLETLLGIAAPAVGSLLGGAFGGGGGGGGKSASEYAKQFELPPNENLQEFLDLSMGQTQKYIDRADRSVFDPASQAAAMANYGDFYKNLENSLIGGSIGPNAASQMLQNYITGNQLPGEYGAGVNELGQTYQRIVQPKQQSTAVTRAFENTLGRAPTGNEMLKFTSRLAGGVAGYTPDDIVKDIASSQEYKDKYGTGGALDAYYDSYYGKRLTETVDVPKSEQQEYKRPSLEAIAQRYGQGQDFGGADVYKARQAGYSSQEIANFIGKNRDLLEGENAKRFGLDFISDILKGKEDQSRMVPQDRGPGKNWDAQDAVPATREVITDQRTFSYAPGRFTKELYETAGLKPNEGGDFTGTIGEIEEFRQNLRDDRKYMYNAGLTELQGDIDKSLQQIKERGSQRRAEIQGQYGMLAGMAQGLFS